jgi:hypothetical protein
MIINRPIRSQHFGGDLVFRVVTRVRDECGMLSLAAASCASSKKDSWPARPSRDQNVNRGDQALLCVSGMKNCVERMNVVLLIDT